MVVIGNIPKNSCRGCTLAAIVEARCARFVSGHQQLLNASRPAKKGCNPQSRNSLCSLISGHRQYIRNGAARAAVIILNAYTHNRPNPVCSFCQRRQGVAEHGVPRVDRQAADFQLHHLRGRRRDVQDQLNEQQERSFLRGD